LTTHYTKTHTIVTTKERIVKIESRAIKNAKLTLIFIGNGAHA